MAIADRVIRMTSADTVTISVAHTARVITRMANGQVLSTDDGDHLMIEVITRFGQRRGIIVETNQLDDNTLRNLITHCEALARENLGTDEEILPQKQVQDEFVPTNLWHDETVRAMTTTRDAVIPDLLSAVANARLTAAGFLGFMARSQAFISKGGIHAYSEETDSELTITARTLDHKSSGWSGQAARNWATVTPSNILENAIAIAKQGVEARAVEPGRRTAILSLAAFAQMVRLVAEEYDAYQTDFGATAFSRSSRGNKLGQHVFDPRITMRSDPNDTDGGYSPYFGEGYATPVMTWIDKGILKNLAYDPTYAMTQGKVYADRPYSIRVSGGTTPVSRMIAQCREGIYVNRISNVEMIDLRTGLMTGVTRDGCFLVKDGKIDRPVKNFRFLESPFFFLNRIEALGTSERAALGYMPKSARYDNGPTEWPRPPIIAPPIMVRDFNFNALTDAV